MCLLVVLSRVHPEFPLIVAANRDELLARKATPMTVMRASVPRILGGRDEVAGGTWLAVNEHGVFAGLTNAPPTRAGRDPSKKSRGELPLLLAGRTEARAASIAFGPAIKAGEYNPCWLLCGDRDALFYLDLTQPDPVTAEELPAGIHVLENRPLHASSPKVDAVRNALEKCHAISGAELVPFLQALLKRHDIPPERRPFRAAILPGLWRRKPSACTPGPMGRGRRKSCWFPATETRRRRSTLLRGRPVSPPGGGRRSSVDRASVPILPP
jgi:uncharacterized protein with NRDE domain